MILETMKDVVLMCTECEYQVESSSEKRLMNKIIMWNHVKKTHPYMAERLTRAYQTLPHDLFDMRPALR